MNYAKSFSFRVRDPRIFPEAYKNDDFLGTITFFAMNAIRREFMDKLDCYADDSPTCDLDNWMGL